MIRFKGQSPDLYIWEFVPQIDWSNMGQFIPEIFTCNLMHKGAKNALELLFKPLLSSWKHQTRTVGFNERRPTFSGCQCDQIFMTLSDSLGINQSVWTEPPVAPPWITAVRHSRHQDKAPPRGAHRFCRACNGVPHIMCPQKDICDGTVWHVLAHFRHILFLLAHSNWTFSSGSVNGQSRTWSSLRGEVCSLIKTEQTYQQVTRHTVRTLRRIMS